MHFVDVHTLRAGHLYIGTGHGGCRPHWNDDL